MKAFRFQSASLSHSRWFLPKSSLRGKCPTTPTITPMDVHNYAETFTENSPRLKRNCHLGAIIVQKMLCCNRYIHVWAFLNRKDCKWDANGKRKNKKDALENSKNNMRIFSELVPGGNHEIQAFYWDLIEHYTRPGIKQLRSRTLWNSMNKCGCGNIPDELIHSKCTSNPQRDISTPCFLGTLQSIPQHVHLSPSNPCFRGLSIETKRFWPTPIALEHGRHNNAKKRLGSRWLWIVWCDNAKKNPPLPSESAHKKTP